MMSPAQILELIPLAAVAHDLDPAIVYGVCMQESRLNPLAARYEKGYQWLYHPKKVRPKGESTGTETIFQKTSIGLMQVMGAVYREAGYGGWLTELFSDPAKQLDFGCKHLAKKIKKYGLEGGIAAYNAGTPRKNADGKYKNQHYVDAVLRFADTYTDLNGS